MKLNLPAHSTISSVWNIFTKPSKNIRFERKRESQLLNQITFIFLQLVFVLFFVILILPPSAGILGSYTLTALFFAILLLTVVLFVSRMGYYYLATSILFSSAMSLIYWNASVSSSPHLEISYLILLPLIATIILDLRSTVILTIIATIVFWIFQSINSNTIPPEIFRDLSLLIVLTHVLVIVVAYWRNKIEQERRQLFLEQEKSVLIRELIGNMSHDFKTPLAIMNTSLYLLGKVTDPDKKQAQMDKAKRQVQRLEGYIQDMLTILRLEDNELNTQHMVYINTIIETVLAELSDEIQQKNHTVTLTLDDSQSGTLANTKDIYRMVENLVKNAIIYTPDAGQIIITTHTDKKYNNMTIQDNGIGLSEEEKTLIFERFYRADKARSLPDGTGLGLPIVKRVIELYGGDITLDSTLGEGTTFKVRLPVKNKPQLIQK